MEEQFERVDYRIKHLPAERIKKRKVSFEHLEPADKELVSSVYTAFEDVKNFFIVADIDMSIDINKIKLPDIYVSDDITVNGVSAGGALVFNKALVKLIAKNKGNSSISSSMELIIKHEIVHYLVDHFEWVRGIDENDFSFRGRKGAVINIEKFASGQVVDGRSLFRGYDEGLTNFIAVLLTYKAISPDKIFESMDSVDKYTNKSYPDETLMIYKMWHIVQKETPGVDVFKLLLESTTNKNPKFFHLIKKVYGKKAVKLLSEFRPLSELGFDEYGLAITNDMIREFFSTEDRAKRKRLKQIIFDRMEDL